MPAPDWFLKNRNSAVWRLLFTNCTGYRLNTELARDEYLSHPHQYWYSLTFQAVVMYQEPQAMAQFVLKIEKLSHIMGPTPILEMAPAYGLRPQLWLLDVPIMRNTVLSSFNLRSLFNIQKRMSLMQSYIFLTTASCSALSFGPNEM